jgi:hypothetical protein
MIELCGRCGVPLMLSSEYEWGSNGVISLTQSSHNRMVFFESETIDRLFRGVEGMIGVPIEHIAIESRRRETRRFIERGIPPETRKMMEGVGGRKEGEGLNLPPEQRAAFLRTMKEVAQHNLDIGFVFGYGEQLMGDLWDTDADFPWRTRIIQQPYSVIFLVADVLGSVEAFESADMRVLYDQIERNVYRVEVYPGEHPLELTERLKRKRYDFKPGDIKFERCDECGIPMLVAHRIWSTDKGTIMDPETGRRMAVFGPMAMDSIFVDLEAEIGDVIPETIIEAQRRQIKIGWDVESWNRDGSTFQEMLAIRGLGNLTKFEGDRNHLDIVVENACLHLPMIGTAQALVELAYKAHSSTCEWELSDDGDLSLTININK